MALVFHVFIAVTVMVIVCGRRGLWPHGVGPEIQAGKIGSPIVNSSLKRCEPEACVLLPNLLG